MGVQSGSLKVYPSEVESMNYCTTQILSDMLLRILNIQDLSLAKRKLAKIKLIIVDEVHTLDLAMMSVLKVISDILEKYGNYRECPIFMFASATIDTDSMVEYYFKDKNVLEDPLMYGYVGGLSNHPVVEKFLDKNLLSDYIKEENQSKIRKYGFSLAAQHFYKNFYDQLWASKSYGNFGLKFRVQCRDVLFFVPLTFGIDAIGDALINLIKDKPTFLIRKGENFNNVKKWRDQNRNKNRILIVGFARDFSAASDQILSSPIDPDEESLLNETKIFIATPILETGKTIYTLQLCIDLGLQTTTINNPLAMNLDDSLKYLKQIPANVNQTIQRLGRVGRVAPGQYLHFYSEDVYKQFQKSDTPETINSCCLSGLFLKTIRKYSLMTILDMCNENDFLFPTTVDIIIRSTQDLISSGFLTIFGEFTELIMSKDSTDVWILYAKYLYSIQHYSLFAALLVALLNMKRLAPVFSVREIPQEKLQSTMLDSIKNNKKPNATTIDAIRMARNYISATKYSNKSPFALISSMLF